MSLKGLEEVDIGEIVPFAPGEVEAAPLDGTEPLVLAIRQEFHQERDRIPIAPPDFDTTTSEQAIDPELLVCLHNDPDGSENDVIIGEWDPRSDNLRRPLRFPRGDFLRLFALKGELNAELFSSRRETVRDLYTRLSDRTPSEAVPLADFRDQYATFVLGAVVEKL